MTRPLQQGLVAALVGCVALAVAGCEAQSLSTDELVAAMQSAGLVVEDAQKERAQMQRELDELSDALATGVPMPRMEKTLKVDGVIADLFWCPGRREQAQAVVAASLRGQRDSDPAFLVDAVAALTGNLNLAVQDHVLSMRPTREQDAAVLKIAKALAAIDAR